VVVRRFSRGDVVRPQAVVDHRRGTLDFTGNRDFASLSPALAQTFFIGDGRTATGRPQRFNPPPGATRLYFGLADAWKFQGPPGFYADNSGSFEVAVSFH
jgi:hypothetical protein